ncbi:hypothetical protein WMY93_003597 [Mugilogobius chulae]|uniref:Uncharacterized protein n=1 Tax=Mugilogobius chulae TaxID=88201 RepID=A0AAW0PX32_9GOBI
MVIRLMCPLPPFWVYLDELAYLSHSRLHATDLVPSPAHAVHASPCCPRLLAHAVPALQLVVLVAPANDATVIARRLVASPSTPLLQSRLSKKSLHTGCTSSRSMVSLLLEELFYALITKKEVASLGIFAAKKKMLSVVFATKKQLSRAQQTRLIQSHHVCYPSNTPHHAVQLVPGYFTLAKILQLASSGPFEFCSKRLALRVSPQASDNYPEFCSGQIDAPTEFHSGHSDAPL